MGKEKSPKNFEDVTRRIAKACVLIGTCEVLPPANNQIQINNILSHGSGFFIHKSGILVTARHVLPNPLPPNKSIIAIQKIDGSFWASWNGQIIYDFPDLDVTCIKFDRTVDTIPIRQHPLKQGAEIGVFGYPNSRVQFQNGQLVGPLVKGRVSQTTIGNAERTTMHFNGGAIQLNDKKIIESQFIFVSGNSGGPVFSARDGKVVGVVTGVHHIPQSAQNLTVNQQPVVGVPFASFSYAISIHELIPRLNGNEFSFWWK